MLLPHHRFLESINDGVINAASWHQYVQLGDTKCVIMVYCIIHPWAGLVLKMEVGLYYVLDSQKHIVIYPLMPCKTNNLSPQHHCCVKYAAMV